MTHDPQRTAQLVAMLRECDRRAVKAPWISKGYGFGVGFCHGFQDDSTLERRNTGAINAEVIATLRNNAREVASQLEAAEKEIERLNETMVPAGDWLTAKCRAMCDTLLGERSALRAEVERLRAEVANPWAGMARQEGQRVIAENDALLARLAVVEPVFEAAKALHESAHDVATTAMQSIERFNANIHALYAAIDAALASPGQAKDYESPVHESQGPSRPAKSRKEGGHGE